MADLQARIMAARAKAGLVLQFEITGDEVFTRYPNDEASKQKWIAEATAKGWRLKR